MTDLDELKALAEAATPGPWALDDLDTLNVISVHDDSYTPELGTYLNVSINGFYKDSRFIAAANPQTVLALIERVRKAEGELRDFKLLIAGGEDTPGHADTLTLGEAEKLLTRQWQVKNARISELEQRLAEYEDIPRGTS